MTDALGDEFASTEPHGVQAVLSATFDAVPEGNGSALNSAQAIDWDRKRGEARAVLVGLMLWR